MDRCIPQEPIGVPEGYPETLPPNEVDRRFRALLGDTAIPTVPLELRVSDEALLPGGVVRQRVEYQVEPGEIVPALHLFRTDLPSDAPGLLSIHGHGGDDIFPVGKEFHAHPDADDPMQYSYAAALRGFRVLAPDALCFGERRASFGYASGFMDEIVAHAELCARRKSLMWKSVWDNSRALEALGQLGARSLSALGWSGGSTQAYLLAAVNPTVAATACLFSFTLLREQFYRYRAWHCLYHYLPGMVSAGIDFDQIVALVPPRRLFFAWGGLDAGTPESSYRAYVEAIRARCHRDALPDALTLHEDPTVGHEITPGMLDAALRFLSEAP